MEQPGLTPEAAIAEHRRFLQEILAEVMAILGVGTASEERLITALLAYWDAGLARRDCRLRVIEATRGTAFEKAVEPMGKPFLMMVRAELQPRRGAAADEAALQVYEQARRIAVDEARTGVADEVERTRLIAYIRA